MFILRRITSEGNQVNICLNQSYNLVLKETNKEEFNKAAVAWSEGITDYIGIDQTIYGFIIYNDGKDISPLYLPSSYYIMTGNGDTFSNITFK